MRVSLIGRLAAARRAPALARAASSERSYYVPTGGHPPQAALMTQRAVFTEAYAVLPKGVIRDIVSSVLPHWTRTRAWVLARPLSGFAETFAQYVVEVQPGGGSDAPEPDARAEGVLFVVGGELDVAVDGAGEARLDAGGYCYVPPGAAWRARNAAGAGGQNATFHWVRKAYERVDGVDAPPPFFSHDRDVAPTVMPDTAGAWATTRFVDPDDARHDMHVNIVTFKPGGSIPFEETHVMEHGLYVLQGKGVYKLNRDWVEVEAGDFMWLRAFCPQACYAGGPDDFRYLLYKDVNRHPRLRPAPQF